MDIKAPKTLDNKENFVYTELESAIKKGSKVSIMSGYFSMYAYFNLRKTFNKIDNLRFIYAKPTFL